MPSAAQPPNPDLSFQALVEQSIVGVYVIQDDCFVYSNETWAGFFGRTPAEMAGMPLHETVPPGALDETLRNVRRRISGEVASVRYVTPAIHRDGHLIHLEVHGSRMSYRGRLAVCGVGIDVTERVKRDAELRQARTDLQELAAQINRDREDQRALFAREIHDVLGGLLASIKMDVQRIARRVDGAELKGITAGLMEVTQEAIQTVREMSEELRPSGLDHLGLQETIDRDLSRFGARYGIRCRFDSPAPVAALLPHRATSIYRIYQEGINNVAKHAAASQVTVHLQQQGGRLLLQIDDDGSGLAGAPPRLDARGILGMRERARELGGTLEIEARAGGGTCLKLNVPVAP